MFLIHGSQWHGFLCHDTPQRLLCVLKDTARPALEIRTVHRAQHIQKKGRGATTVNDTDHTHTTTIIKPLSQEQGQKVHTHTHTHTYTHTCFNENS